MTRIRGLGSLVLAGALGLHVQAAQFRIHEPLQAKLGQESSLSDASARYAYTVEAEPLSKERLRSLAALVGVTPADAFDAKRTGYFTRANGVRAAALYNAADGRYVCYSEDPHDMELRSAFPRDLNARVRTLLAQLVPDVTNFAHTGMNDYAVKGPAGTPAYVYRRSYELRRTLDGRVVLAPEGAVTIQYNRAGRVTLAELPAVRVTRQTVTEPVDPGRLTERLAALAAQQDTIISNGRALPVDSVVAVGITRSYRPEHRGGARFLVPYQSVLVDCCLKECEPVRREMHFTLDRASKAYVACDPWLAKQ